MIKKAHLSADRIYRYWLFRQWDATLPVLCVFGVNPSTADESEDDATIRKGIGFAKRSGFGSLLKLNVGAFRAKDPRAWREAADPIGPDNTLEHLREYSIAFNVAKLVAAWGQNGRYAQKQCAAIADAFPEMWCWGRNLDGTPKHPARVSYKVPLERFQLVVRV